MLLVGLGPEDAADLLDLHQRLSERDRYFRFGTLHPRDLEDYIERTLAGTGGAISVGARSRGRLIGAVQLIPSGGDAGEVAVVVDPAYRDLGLATVLLEHLAALGLQRGIGRLIADVLAENQLMLRVLRDLGLPVGTTREGTSLRIEVALHADERYAAATDGEHGTPSISCACGFTASTSPRYPEERSLRSTARPIECSPRPAPMTTTASGSSTARSPAAAAARCRGSVAAA